MHADDKPRLGLLRLCQRAAELADGLIDRGFTEAQAMTVVRLYALSCLAPRTTPPIPYTEPAPLPSWPDAEDE